MGDVFVGDDDVAADVDGYGALPLSGVRARTLHRQAPHRALRCIAPELPGARADHLHATRRTAHCALLCTLGCCMVASIKTSIACPTPFPVARKFSRTEKKARARAALSRHAACHAARARSPATRRAKRASRHFMYFGCFMQLTPSSIHLPPVPARALSCPARSQNSGARARTLRRVTCRTCALRRRAPRRARVASFYVFACYGISLHAAVPFTNPSTSTFRPPRARSAGRLFRSQNKDARARTLRSHAACHVARGHILMDFSLVCRRAAAAVPLETRT